MRAASSQRYDAWEEAAPANNIIYLQQRQPYEKKRYYYCQKRRRTIAGAFWDILFSVLCVSVLVVLFLH